MVRKLQVGTGRGKLDIRTAVSHAQPGDTIELSPGVYDIQTLEVRGLTLRGVGSPGTIVLRGRVDARAHCTFTNIAFQAEPYQNALSLRFADSYATLEDCSGQSEPAAQFPAVWVSAGTLVLNRTSLHHDEGRTLALENGATLHATASTLGRVYVSASRADLIDCGVIRLRTIAGARITSYGTLTCAPDPGQRIFVAEERSACTFPQLRLPPSYVEAYFNDSLLQVDAISAAPEQTLTVIAENNAKVVTTSPSVTVMSQDELSSSNAHPEPAPEPAAPEPAFVHWPISKARSFTTEVLPRVGTGDTVLLDEGDYFLEDDATDLRLDFNLAGQGRADRTILHATVGVVEGASATVANLTLRPVAAQNAVNLDNPGVLALRNVIVDTEPDGEFPAVFASAGTLELRDCMVQASAEGGPYSVDVTQSARLDAASSELGWFSASDGADAALSHCASYGLYAVNGSSVLVSDTHTIHGSSADLLHLLAQSDSRLQVPRLIGGDSRVTARVSESLLTILELEQGPGADRMAVVRVGEATLEFGEFEYDLYDADESGVWTLVASAEPGAHAYAVAPDADRSTDPDEDDDDASSATHPTVPEGEDPLAELHALTGLERVKAQVQGFIDRVEFDRRRAELGFSRNADFTLHSMFLGNPGTGKTTVAKLLGKALHRAGVVSKDVFIEADRDKLTSSNISGTAEKTKAVLESALGGVLFIDEAYALAQEGNTHFAQESVDTILAFMEDHRTDLMVIFAGYSDKMQDFLAMNDGLTSRIPHRFDFEDYSADEVATIGHRALLRDDFVVNESLYRRIVAADYARSGDRSNGRWVRNFNQKLLQQMVSRLSSVENPSAEQLTRITDADLQTLAGNDPSSNRQRLDELFAELDSLVGLEPVKRWVRSLANQAKVNQRMLELDGSLERPNYHVTFTGNPGTGKTTVARIVAGLFHSLGVLGSPTVKEANRAQLVGRHYGDAEELTSRALDEAMGGVLFVDEAYLLTGNSGGDGSGARDPGMRAIDVMLPRLENDRDKFVAIFAGYTEDMERFFDSNPGLRSRVPTTIEFPDYTAAETAEIVVRILSTRWLFNSELVAQVTAAAYDALPPHERDNGRWARNIAEQIGTAHMDYLAEHDVQGEEMKRIPDDVIRGFLPG